MLPSDSFPQRQPNLKWEIVDNEAVVYDHTTGQVTYLNETATLVWALCDGTRPADTMIALLTEALGGDSSVDPSDVRDALEALERAALIEPGHTAQEGSGLSEASA